MKRLITLAILTILLSNCALKPITPPRVQNTPKSHQAMTHKQPVTPIMIKQQPRTTKHKSFTPTETMALPTLNHKVITFQAEDNILHITNPEYQGTDVVLYLFGRDCVHCRHEIKEIRKLARLPKLKVLGIHAQKMIGDRALKSYAQKIGYHFDILSFKKDVKLLKYLDKNGLWEGGTPTHLRVDQDGNIEEMSLSMLFRIYGK